MAEPRSEYSPENQSPPTSDSTPVLPKIVRFADLSKCGDEIWIDNGGQLYRLRKTRQGKLILTK